MKNTPFNRSATHEAVTRAVYPLQSGDGKTYFYGTRTDAGHELPPYYLVYFLLVDLLEYPCFGRQEKIAWSVPVQLNGQLFIIEQRKLGFGVFCNPNEVYEEQAKEVVALIQKGVRAAHPFFDLIAANAVNQSKVSLINKSTSLFNRFEFFLTQYEHVSEEARQQADEKIVETKQLKEGVTVTSYHFPVFELERNAKWFALAAIDSFFSWTEHMFIHLAVLLGKIVTAAEVADLAEAEWTAKFKAVFILNKRDTKNIYDDLVLIRRQLRNYMAHGAFGKQGEAFTFHSAVGAVPVLLPHKSDANRFTIVGELAFDERAAIQVIKRFITHVWNEDREPAYHYIQESGLPTILTMAADGRYQAAMQSVEDMKYLIDYLNYSFDMAANMDW